MLDHPRHLGKGIVAAGVLLPVGEDGDDHLGGPLLFGRRSQAHAHIVDRAPHGVEQRRHSAWDKGLGVQRRNLPDGDVVVHHQVFMIEKHQRQPRLARQRLLRGQKGIEPTNGVAGYRVHGAGTIEHKGNLR